MPLKRREFIKLGKTGFYKPILAKQ